MKNPIRYNDKRIETCETYNDRIGYNSIYNENKRVSLTYTAVERIKEIFYKLFNKNYARKEKEEKEPRILKAIEFKGKEQRKRSKLSLTEIAGCFLIDFLGRLFGEDCFVVTEAQWRQSEYKKMQERISHCKTYTLNYNHDPCKCDAVSVGKTFRCTKFSFSDCKRFVHSPCECDSVVVKCPCESHCEHCPCQAGYCSCEEYVSCLQDCSCDGDCGSTTPHC